MKSVNEIVDLASAYYGSAVLFNEEAGLEWMHRAADAGVPAAKRYLGEE